MRILFAVHQFFPEHYAGTEVLTLGLAHELKSRGHEPYILAAKRSRPIHDFSPYETEDYTYEGIPVRRIGRPSEEPPVERRLEYDNVGMAKAVGEYAREVSPDVVHVMHMQGLSARVLEEFGEGGLGIPVVYTATDFWSVCPVVDMKRHDGKMCLGPDLSHCLRCIASRRPRHIALGLERKLGISGRLPNGMFGSGEDIEAIKDRTAYIREKLSRVDRIIAPTRLMKDMLLSNGVGDSDSVEVSHYGIDTRDIKDVRNSRNDRETSCGEGEESDGESREKGLRVGFMGTLGPHKGCDTLIKAFRRMPEEMDATLTIYGNLDRFVPFVRKLRQLAGDDDRITFAGTFAPEKIGVAFSGIDVLVVPSRWYENTPLVLYSAFAAGVPVVATNLGGMSEVVEDGKNGLLFELDDDRGLGRQLCRLWEEEGLLGRLRDGIGDVKTIGQNAEELCDLYARLVKSR